MEDFGAGKTTDTQNFLSCLGIWKIMLWVWQTMEAWLMRFQSEVRKPNKDSTRVIPCDILNLEPVGSGQLGQLLCWESHCLSPSSTNITHKH